MFILLLPLCAAAVAAAAVASHPTPNIPPINGQDRSGFFNFMKQEFESRRMHVNIVDTVSKNYTSAEHSPSFPTLLSIGLVPLEKDPDDYAFLSRKVAEALQCLDATHAAFEKDGSEPEYVLTVDHDNTLAIYRDEDSSAEGAEMLRRVALQAGMSHEEAGKVELVDCWYMRSPEMMRINVALGEVAKMQSGWIVERYPVGRFYQNPTISYRYPIYITNHSYIDGWSGAIVDVHESKDENGNRVWTPSSWPAFALVAMEQVDVKDMPDYTLFRETDTGVLITSRCPNMSLSYNIDNVKHEEHLVTDGHFFHVTCDRKQGTRRLIMEIRGYPHHSNATTNDEITITMSALDGNHTFHCPAKRATPTGIPEMLQLDYVEQAGVMSISPSERNLTTRQIDTVMDESPYAIPMKAEEEEEELEEAKELPYSEEQLYNRPSRKGQDAVINLYEEMRPYPSRLPEDGEYRKMIEQMEETIEEEAEEEFLCSLALMLVAVALLALVTVIALIKCATRCAKKSRKHVAHISPRDGKAQKRKEGRHDLPTPAPAQSAYTVDEKCTEKPEDKEEEQPASTPIPARSNSGKRKLTFAPRKAPMRTEDLVKMISDAEIGQKIDAMVEAGPDGEPDVEQKHSTSSAPIAVSEVVDETSDAGEFFDACETASNETDQTLLID